MSDSDEENVIRYGTPLEPYEEDEVPVKKKFHKDVSEQYAVDAHGRRRFHGAFTGGFSAGHGNSVGTPEGFTPATFKSTRSEKAQSTSQRPEDFMDEEDRSEFGIAPRLIQTQSEFSGQKRQHQKQFHDGPIPGTPVLGQLLQVVHETAAVRMLRALGWRPGQGAGARQSARGRRGERSRRRRYGCAPQPAAEPAAEGSAEEGSSGSEAELEYDALFAPEDYEPYLLRHKDDRFGLGYSGLSRRPVLGGAGGRGEGGGYSHLLMTDKGRKVSIRGQAFGVGALEADDDGDVYAECDMSQYDRALGPAEPPPPARRAAPRAGAATETIIPGFVRSAAPLPRAARHPPPAPPAGYAPRARRSRFEPTAERPRNQGLGRHELSAEARGALLGEPPTTSRVPPDDHRPEDSAIQPEQKTEDPVARLLGRNVNFVSTEKIETDGKVVELDYIPISNCGDAPKVFKPFVGDPRKQARYEKYLSDKSAFASERDTGDRINAWERDRELKEFEQAAKLYRPLTGVIGDRFTHATQPDDAVSPLQSVARSAAPLAAPERVQAAKRGLYGVMTRSKAEWRPEGLVCKRFNVPDPYNARPETKKDDKASISYSIFNYMEESIHNKESFAREQTKFSGSKSMNMAPAISVAPAVSIAPAVSVAPAVGVVEKARFEPIIVQEKPPETTKRMTVAELFMKESEKELQANETVTETINQFDKMELYKSIFLSDSEEEEDRLENETADVIDKPKNVERNLSPPRGIFANIDFDELNSWNKIEKKAEVVKINVETPKTVESSSNNAEKDASDLYGPKIPEPLLRRLQQANETEAASKRDVAIEVDSSSNDSWVDAKEVKSKKDKKKKKNKKHKSKHKKKSKMKDR